MGAFHFLDGQAVPVCPRIHGSAGDGLRECVFRRLSGELFDAFGFQDRVEEPVVEVDVCLGFSLFVVGGC